MASIVFDTHSTDRRFLNRYFAGAGNLEDYSVDSKHNGTLFTSGDERRGFVFVGAPFGCPDFVDKIFELRKEYVGQGCRASPEVVDFDDGVAGFKWIASRGKKW